MRGVFERIGLCRAVMCLLLVAGLLLGGSVQAADKTITVSLTNNTGLDSSRYTIYVLAYAQATTVAGTTITPKVLTVNNGVGTFVEPSAAPSTSSSTFPGYITSYELGTDITSIQFASSDVNASADNYVAGARVYFFIYDNLNKDSYQDHSVYSDSTPKSGSVAPRFPYNYDTSKSININIQAPGNPPQTDYPKYNYIELTNATGRDLGNVFVANPDPFVVDVSTVDGLFSPLHVASDVDTYAGGGLGQPINQPTITLDAIGDAYTAAFSSSNTAYAALKLSDNSLLNPGHFLDPNNGDPTSPLHVVFDKTLNAFFAQSSGYSISNDSSDSYYSITASGSQTVPNTTNTHTALTMSKTGTSSGTFYLFNPVGFTAVNYSTDGGKTFNEITGTIALDPTDASKYILTFDNNLPATGYDGTTPLLAVGMYVHEKTETCTTFTATQIQSITYADAPTNSKIKSVTISGGTIQACSSTFSFSKSSDSVFLPPMSSGAMVFACTGIFNNFNAAGDDANLLRDVNMAFQRGVALMPGAATNGGSTIAWGTQSNWYPTPADALASNEFSYFMHTGKVGSVPIFTVAASPAAAVSPARDSTVTMGMSYGFSYDEDTKYYGGLPTPQPQVPSKYDSYYPTTLTVTLLPYGSTTSETNATITQDPASSTTAYSRNVTVTWNATGNNYPYTINWGDGTTVSVPKKVTSGLVSGPHSYSSAGTYTISITNKNGDAINITNTADATVVIASNTSDYAKMMSWGNAVSTTNELNYSTRELEPNDDFSLSASYTGATAFSGTGLTPCVLICDTNIAGATATQTDLTGITPDINLKGTDGKAYFYIANPTSTTPAITPSTVAAAPATSDVYSCVCTGDSTGKVTVTFALERTSSSHENGWQDLNDACDNEMPFYLRAAWCNTTSGTYSFNDFYTDYNTVNATVYAYRIAAKTGPSTLPGATSSGGAISNLNVPSGLVDYRGTAALATVRAYTSSDVGSGMADVVGGVQAICDVGAPTAETTAETDSEGFLHDPRAVGSLRFNFKPTDIYSFIGASRILLTENGFYILKSSSPNSDQSISNGVIEIKIVGITGEGLVHISHDSSSANHNQPLTGGYASKAAALAAATTSGQTNAFLYGTYYYDSAEDVCYIYAKMFGGITSGTDSSGSSGGGGCSVSNGNSMDITMIAIFAGALVLMVLRRKRKQC